MMGKSLYISDNILPSDLQQQAGDEQKVFWKKIYIYNRT